MAENILVVKPSSIGDIVHSLPVLAKLRAKYPKARISWLVEASLAPLVEANPLLDAVIPFRRRAGGAVKTLLAQRELLARLGRERFDLVIDLQGLLRSAIFTYATGAPKRVGLSDAREGARFFYTDVVEVKNGMHAADRYLRVGEAVGFAASGPEFRLEVARAARGSALGVLSGPDGAYARPNIAFSLGARWPSKNWPAANFADAGRRLVARTGGTVFILGAASARKESEEIVKAMGAGAVNLVGRTSLAELAAVIGEMDVVVTPDTGVMHMADALGKRIVAVFGPTDPAKTGPYFQRANVMVAKNVCELMPCMRRDCPRSDTICMKSVSGEEAALAAERQLEGKQ